MSIELYKQINNYMMAVYLQRHNALDNIIPHLHNLFLCQCDVTLSLNCYECPEQTVY